MNKTEYLLTCLLEECAEVQQEICKALRFGLESSWGDDTRKTSKKIIDEMTDLISVYSLLDDEGVIPTSNVSMKAIEAKKMKVKKFMKLSIENETLQTGEDS